MPTFAGKYMTNQTILSLLNYLCNEARNSVQASFGLMALWPTVAPIPPGRPAWRTVNAARIGCCAALTIYGSCCRPKRPAFDPAEEFDVTLCLGEIMEVLNLASGDRASRLILQSAARPVTGRQPRRAVEQALTRILDAVSKLATRGEALMTAARASECDGVQFEIVPANSNIALRVADWLNSDADLVNFEDSDEVLCGVATLVAGKRIRELGGTAEFVSDAPRPWRWW